jgi:AcrR family transcriptional regulator
LDSPTTEALDLATTVGSHEVLQHRGRPLDASRDVALREAALELLAEHGYDCLTIESIAALARASKVTIYRRWSGKAELVVDALSCRKGSPATSDTGSLRGDLEAIARNVTSTDSRFDAQLRMGLFTALARDAELRQVFRERLVDPHVANLRQVFERAVGRGEISEERNLDLIVLVLPALVSHHLLIFGEPPGSDFVKRVIDDVVMPLATAPATSG